MRFNRSVVNYSFLHYPPQWVRPAKVSRRDTKVQNIKVRCSSWCRRPVGVENPELIWTPGDACPPAASRALISLSQTHQSTANYFVSWSYVTFSVIFPLTHPINNTPHTGIQTHKSSEHKRHGPGKPRPLWRQKERVQSHVIGRFCSPAGCDWCASHPSRRCTACPGGTGRWLWPPPGWRGPPPSAPGGGRCRAPGSGWAGPPRCELAGSPTPDWPVEERWRVELASHERLRRTVPPPGNRQLEPSLDRHELLRSLFSSRVFSSVY